MKSTLLELVTSKKFLAAVTATIVVIAGRYGFDVDTAVLDRIYAALLVYVGAQGAADVGKSAAQVRAVTATAGIEPEASAALKRIAATIAVLLFAVGASSTLACSSSSAGPRAAAGVGAFLDCESPHVDAQMLADAKVVAKSAIEKWLSGAGTIDTAGLKADAKPIRSDLLKCAFDAAIAALATPTPSSPPEAPQAAPLVVDAAQVRAAWMQVRGELGWPPARAGG